ncbi:UNVERIFIED_CONTAM: hypothetical protein PYX00_008767 [Menopon gallinae]|uniref:T-complex protein 1 subunit delta n=1 Tax=Menopon gallinae TaxID=328185 RepID=A0AAW2HQU9_9NEOP
MSETTGSGDNKKPQCGAYKNRAKPSEVRSSNIGAAKAVADAVRTSLGPRGMDKMIQRPNGEVTITNDGATLLKQMGVVHPAAKLLVELAKAQDAEAGDGTTSVVVIAGALLEAAEKLLSKGIHPTAVSDSFQRAAVKAVEIVTDMATPIDLADRESLIGGARTALNSKAVAQHSGVLGPLAVEAVLRITEDFENPKCDLNNVKVIKKLGGTVEDTELIDGLVFNQKTASANGPKRVEKAKIGLVQFCISRPKTDMDQEVIVTDYAAMDRILKEERNYILDVVKQIKRSGCNVLLVQKSVLRTSVSDLAQHFLDKIKVMVIKDVEREDVEFVSKTLNCRPVASPDHFLPEHLACADLVEEVRVGNGSIVKITGIQNMGKTTTVLIRGSNKLVLDEAERSLRDSMCAVRCLVKKRALVAGGGAPEIEIATKLADHARFLSGVDGYCFAAFANAFEVIPSTLAENAGLDPVSAVTELRSRHSQNDRTAGISVRKGTAADVLQESVLQPLLVCTNSVTLACETVRSILKIDDIVSSVSP